MSDASQRQVVVVASSVLLLLGLWHASPLLLWHLRFESELAAETAVPRLFAPSRATAPPPPGWNELRVANFSLRLPLARAQADVCATCRQHCVLPLRGGGTLAVFDDAPREDLAEARDRFAPHPDDLSLWRSVTRNWQTIDALADRARVSAEPPASFRFEAPGSQGVVTGFTVNARRRYVVYAYGPEGARTRTLGVTGVSEERFDQILGSLDVSARPEDGTATCR